MNVMYGSLMVKRLMDSVCKDRDETQRENIFHTRCMVMGKKSEVLRVGRPNLDLVVFGG